MDECTDTRRIGGDYAMRRRVHLGPLGYLGCVAVSVTLAALTQGWRSAIACAVAVSLALLCYPTVLQQLRRPRFWIFNLFLVFSSALLLSKGERETQALVFTFSVKGIETGVQMALRVTTMLLSISGCVGALGATEMAVLLERVGLRGLGFALGVAVSMLPVIQETTRNAFSALRLRGGLRRRRLSALRLLLLTIIANSLRYGDQVVTAAEGRAFSPERNNSPPLRWSSTDLVVVGTLITLAVALAR